MAKIVELPRLSDTMEEGVIAKWHIAVGDKVKRGQVIADIETDKATMEFESFDAGVVLQLVAPEGEVLAIGSPIAVLGKAGEDPKGALEQHGGGSAEPAERPAPSGEPTEAIEAPVPESARTTMAPSEKPTVVEAGSLDRRDAEADADVELGRTPDRIAASPVARRLARERGIDLRDVDGSGPHGRIVKDDVEAAVVESRPTRVSAVPGRPAALHDALGRPFIEHADAPVKLSQMRKAIARRMSQANAEIPHFYLTSVIDMGAAVTLRSQLKGAIETKVSFNDLVLMATAKALVEHPAVNAYWDGQTIVRRGNVHLGMAVAVDEGLIVPVIRFADQRSLREIAAAARDLGTRGRDKKLVPDEMSGSTFTVSNLGMFGIDEFSAVINPGEGAILAVGAIADVAVPRDGQIVIGKQMKITLACDHRVMDGAIGAQFLATVRRYLEQPLAMLA